MVQMKLEATLKERSEDRPEIVCLCGSTRFKEAFKQYEMEFTLGGYIVLTCGLFAHADKLVLTEKDKACLDKLHLRKIDLADSLFVVNLGGYIGESTRGEIDYARRVGKPIWYADDLAPPEGG